MHLRAEAVTLVRPSWGFGGACPTGCWTELRPASAAAHALLSAHRQSACGASASGAAAGTRWKPVRATSRLPCSAERLSLHPALSPSPRRTAQLHTAAGAAEREADASRQPRAGAGAARGRAPRPSASGGPCDRRQRGSGPAGSRLCSPAWASRCRPGRQSAPRDAAGEHRRRAGRRGRAHAADPRHNRTHGTAPSARSPRSQKIIDTLGRHRRLRRSHAYTSGVSCCEVSRPPRLAEQGGCPPA